MNGFVLRDGTVEVIAAARKRCLGTLKLYVTRPGNDNFYKPFECTAESITCDKDRICIGWRCAKQGIAVCLKLEESCCGYVGKIEVSGCGHAIVRLSWELPEDSFYFPFVPAFMYGNNEGGNSRWATYPQLENGLNGGFHKPWVAEEWLMRADRSSHGFSSIIGSEFACAVGGRDVCIYADGSTAEKTGLGISSSHLRRISFSLGYSNVPYTYSTVAGRNSFGRPEGYINLDNGTVTGNIFIFIKEHSGLVDAASGLLRDAYGIMHDDIAYSGTINGAISDISAALCRYGYCNQARNFYVTLSVDKDGDGVPEDSLFNTAWAGGLRTAYPLLKAGHIMKDDRWLECARSVLDNASLNGISEKSGLFYENYDLKTNQWNTRGWWYRMLEQPGHSGYVNGQACYYLLAAYTLELGYGVKRESWLEASQKVLERVIKGQGKDGRFGYTYREDNGSILDGDGFSGCWFVPALLLLYEITGEERYTEAAIRAMDFYRRFITAFNVYGGPHDIFKSPDEEGVLAWIRASHIFHRMTGEEKYMQDLVMGLEYEFSWRFPYNVVNELEPLKSKKWCSTGGSVTSVNNSHIHPMGSSILDSMRYAAEKTGDGYLKSRFSDAFRWTLTAYLQHDGDYDWGKKGLINERFCYTDSLLAERYPDGSPAATWFCAHSWASGAVLEGLVEVYETMRG